MDQAFLSDNRPAGDPSFDEEDEATLAAIDEGIRQIDAGQGIPLEEARKRLAKWTTRSSSRPNR